MPESPARARGVIALAMLASAVALAVLAGLIYSGTLPMSDEVRGLAALVVGVAAFADFGIALWFFRMGQST